MQNGDKNKKKKKEKIYNLAPIDEFTVQVIEQDAEDWVSQLK